MAKQDDQDEIKRIRDLFKRASEAEAEDRVEMQSDLKFVRLGGEHQWPDYARKARSIQGAERPMLTDNRTKQFRTSVINNLRLNTPSIKVRPVDDKADKKTADALGGLIRHIEQTTSGDIAKDVASEFAVDCGVGYFGLMTKYVSDDSWEQEIAFRTFADPFKVYIDDRSVMPDGSDMRWAFVVEDLSKEEYEKEYGDDSGEWSESAAADGQAWDTEDTRRIAEFFELTEKSEKLHMLEDGRTVWDEELAQMAESAEFVPVMQTRNATRKKCLWRKMTSTKILEETELPCSWVPIFPVYGDMFWHEGKRHVRGMTRDAKGPQQAFNYWTSTMAEIFGLQSRIPWVVAEGSTEADPNWETANAANHPYLQYRAYDDNGNPLPPPQRQPPPPIPTGYAEQMEIALEGIKAAVGMQNPAIGAQESANQSGRAIRALQAQASIGTAHFADNLARSVSHCGRVLIDMIPRVYDTRRVLRILGADGEPDHVMHDPAQPVAVQKAPNAKGGTDTIYNFSVGKYDVLVEVGPTYASRREEGFEVFTEMARVAPQVMGAAGDLVMRMSDSPYADEIADRIKATIPPQILQATEGDKDEAPNPQVLQAQQQIQQYEQLIQQLDQAIQGMTADLEKAKDDKDIKHAELLLKEREVAIKERDAQVKEMQAIQAMQQPAPVEPASPAEPVMDPRMQLEHEKFEFERDMQLMDRVMKLEAEEKAEHEAMEAKAQQENALAQIAQQLAAQMQQLSARLEAMEAQQAEAPHDEGKEEQRFQAIEAAIKELAESIQGQQTVGIEKVIKNGRLAGGVLVKANGARIPISLQ